ncbi:hypothetical protein EB796_007826 [Bugula neritina]|uniref:Secreted protein n=1 Tax=Bugula neritina TaxID=10212 RepID=A0A7J7K7E1_BUGNE|nr:hypothetical protein EB796_007826 [Bugula neritina]
MGTLQSSILLLYSFSNWCDGQLLDNQPIGYKVGQSHSRLFFTCVRWMSYMEVTHLYTASCAPPGAGELCKICCRFHTSISFIQTQCDGIHVSSVHCQL